MAKLSKEVRERMARALVSHKFNSRAKELMDESVSLFHAAYAERYSSSSQRLMAQLMKLNPEAFQLAKSTCINVGGMRVVIGATMIGKNSIAIWHAECAGKPAYFREPVEGMSIALIERVREYALATKEFSEAIPPAYARALATLDQLGTAKRLQDEWPEALPIIGSFIAIEERTLPVVQLEAINDEFDLPPHEEAA